MPGSHVEDNCCYLKKTGGKFGSKQIYVNNVLLLEIDDRGLLVKKV